MSRLSKNGYAQDKPPAGPPPAYPNQAYHPPSLQPHPVTKEIWRLSPLDLDPPYKPGHSQPQPQPQPQPQIVYVERRQGGNNDAGVCATAWSVLDIY